MTTITYNQVFSKFYSKAEAYDIFELSDEQLVGMKDEWIHSASAEPYVHRLFSSFALDDETQEIKYEMRYPTNDRSDEDFVINVLAIGIIVQWLTGKVNSTLHLKQIVGDTGLKFYSQSTHLAEMQALLNNNKAELRGLIRDRGTQYNSYLNE